jgi:hypothetical protein
MLFRELMSRLWGYLFILIKSYNDSYTISASSVLMPESRTVSRNFWLGSIFYYFNFLYKFFTKSNSLKFKYIFEICWNVKTSCLILYFSYNGNTFASSSSTLSAFEWSNKILLRIWIFTWKSWFDLIYSKSSQESFIYISIWSSLTYLTVAAPA